MFDLDAFREFRQGLAQLRDGDPDAALPLLRQASKRDPENPYYVSYYGLSLAASERRWEEAEKLCHAAVCRARRQAQLYLNLAEVYLAADRRQAAVDTLALGLHYLPKDVRLQTQYGKLCSRRQPVLGFLPRTHVLNRGLGRMRQHLVNVMPRRRWLEVGAEVSASGTAPERHRIAAGFIEVVEVVLAIAAKLSSRAKRGICFSVRFEKPTDSRSGIR